MTKKEKQSYAGTMGKLWQNIEMSDVELQRKLAALLPEKIAVHENAGIDGPFIAFQWKGKTDTCDCRVIGTEWLHVCWIIEQNMHPDKQCDYIDELEQSFRRDENKFFNEKEEKKWPMNHFGRFAVAHASWQQRARAILAIKGVKE